MNLPDPADTPEYTWHTPSNFGFITAALPQPVLEALRKEVDALAADNAQRVDMRNTLAGNIKHEYRLTETHELLDAVVSDYIRAYEEKFHYVQSLKHNAVNTELKLFKAWVNFQGKHEFNPPHDHAGVFSFVIWLDIPYVMEEESRVSPGNGSNFNVAGKFVFMYTDILGNIKQHVLNVDKSTNGVIAVFPAKLHHYVAPFYSSDSARITIAGNFGFANE